MPLGVVDRCEGLKLRMKTVAKTRGRSPATCKSKPMRKPSTRRGPRLIALTAVLDKTGLGKTSIYKLMRKGLFCRPVKVLRRALWLEAEVNRWINEQLAAR